MDNKKELTIEELKKLHHDLLNETNTVSALLQQKVQEEEDRKKTQLALEKEARKKEVDEALDNYNKLLKAYMKDYGAYTSTTYSDDFAWYPNKFWRSFF